MGELPASETDRAHVSVGGRVVALRGERAVCARQGLGGEMVAVGLGGASLPGGRPCGSGERGKDPLESRSPGWGRWPEEGTWILGCRLAGRPRGQMEEELGSLEPWALLWSLWTSCLLKPLEWTASLLPPPPAPLCLSLCLSAASPGGLWWRGKPALLEHQLGLTERNEPG